ncbi:MAG: hypothetical protein ACR2P0_01405 [Acidimicrobiales bacterium]
METLTADTDIAMLIDDVLPEFDTTIIEHIVIDAPPADVFAAAREMDFLQVHSPLVDAAMFVRGLPERVGRGFGATPAAPPPPTMRLSDLFDNAANSEGFDGWLALGEVAGRELVFGAIGKVWQPDIDWKAVEVQAFRAFGEPDYAKIAVVFSVREYGAGRSVLSYEARTAGTDAAASRKFLRYWRLVRPFVRVVMRAALVTVKNLAEAAADARVKA